MQIGIIGLGVVGSAIKYGFEKLGHQVSVYDIAMDTTLADVLKTQVCFICVPTPIGKQGECDTSIVEDTVHNLDEAQYNGVIAIKSTVTPGTTEKLKKEYPKSRICFVPEFLRERCAITDFTENHDICVIGTTSISDYRLVENAHGRYPKQFFSVSPTAAELIKYYNNIYNATLVVLANSFYTVCQKLNVPYDEVKDLLVQRDHIKDVYLDCNEQFRGFGGPCLPKDTAAMDALCKRLKLNIAFFQHILTENAKHPITVPEGMRS
jgi:UDPglucose 6-dehydrogenase